MVIFIGKLFSINRSIHGVCKHNYKTRRDKEKNETELAYLGLFEDYFGKGVGGYALTTAIVKSFEKKIKRMWVHTCTLDHPNAIKNYLARGMKIFKEENLNIRAS